MMDRKREADFKKGSDDETLEEEARKSRKALDEIPAPGTDPLHEGP